MEFLPLKNNMLQPIGKRVLIQIEENVKESKGGIILSEEDDYEETKGVILAVGDELFLSSLNLSVGDTVVIDDLGAEEFRERINNKQIKLKILSIDHILAKVIIDQVAE